MDKPLTGQLYKNDSDRNTYEIYNAEPDFLPTMAQIIECRNLSSRLRKPDAPQ